MNKLLVNYIYNFTYQIFLIIVPLITAPYLSRVLTSEALGIYGYINSIVSIITTFGILGLQDYGYRQIAYNKDDEIKLSETFLSIFNLRILLLVITTIFYFIFCFFSKYKLFFFIQYILIFSIFIDISWLFVGFEDLKIVAFRNFLAKFLTTIGIFIFIKSDADLWKYFAIFNIITFITIISLFSFLKKYIKLKKIKIEKSYLHIIPALKLFIPQVAVNIYLQIDKIMLGRLTNSVSQVAYYEYAEKIILIPLAIITALTTVLMPRMANLFINKDYEKIFKYVNKAINFSMFLAIPMMFGFLGVSRNFIPWYLGEEYITSSYAIMILSPICVLNTLSSVFGSQYLVAINQTKVLTFSYYSSTLINIFLNLYLIPKYGYIGAAISTVFSTFISVTIQYIYIRKNIKFNIVKEIIKKIISGVVMFLFVFLASLYLKISPLNTLIEIILGMVVYISMEFLLKDGVIFYFLNQIIILKINRRHMN